MVSCGTTRLPGYKRPDLSLADRLFIGAVVNLPDSTTPAPAVTVTPSRLARTILTLLMPGGVPGRTIDDCLRVAFDFSRSTGSISELLVTGRSHDWHPLLHLFVGRWMA